MAPPSLEEAQEIADATSTSPVLCAPGPSGARGVLDHLQAAPIAKPAVDENWIEIPAEVRVRRHEHRREYRAALRCPHAAGGRRRTSPPA